MLKDLKKEILAAADPDRAQFFKRFFKTGKGQYGEGDQFHGGLTVPELRKLAKKYRDLSMEELSELISGKFHEERQIALFILADHYKRAEEKKPIVDFYLKNLRFVNNWDLVDGSADRILGDYLFEREKVLLYKFAVSENLWERRIAMIATFDFIKKGVFDDSLQIAEILLQDRQDLIHKAVGWMLREIGKRDREVLEKFLDKYCKVMPRTMLRYAIEKFEMDKRRFYMAK